LLAGKLPQNYQPLHAISGATGEGVRALVQYVGVKFDEIKKRDDTARDAAGL
jgi:hypothetical protein